jgi:hypothetical protein
MVTKKVIPEKITPEKSAPKKVVKKSTPKKVVKIIKPEIIDNEIKRYVDENGTIEEYTITNYKINWVGINRKIREYGRKLKIYNLSLPEFKFIMNVINQIKEGWNKYCNWFNNKFNEVKKDE